MKQPMATAFPRLGRNRLRTAALTGIAAGMVMVVAPGSLANADQQAHAAHTSVPAKLVEDVRNATRQFLDVNAATAAQYQPFLGCVNGPEHGAMGIHYVNGDLVADGEIDVSRPEALIYEPTEEGLELVGVEYIVEAATWTNRHSAPPTLGGQLFQYVPSPNRFGLPGFFELHVWAWRDNPQGAFVDWNNQVSCEHQMVASIGSPKPVSPCPPQPTWQPFATSHSGGRECSR